MMLTDWCLTTTSTTRTTRHSRSMLTCIMPTRPVEARCRKATGAVRTSTRWSRTLTTWSRPPSRGCASVSVPPVWLAPPRLLPTSMAWSLVPWVVTGSITRSTVTRWLGSRVVPSILWHPRFTGRRQAPLPASPHGGVRWLPGSIVMSISVSGSPMRKAGRLPSLSSRDASCALRWRQAAILAWSTSVTAHGVTRRRSSTARCASCARG